MKTKIVITVIMLLSLNTHATDLLSCTATEILGGELEESLSVEEYPDISATQNEVTLGSSSWSESDGDGIHDASTEQTVEVILSVGRSTEKYRLLVTRETRKGLVLYQANDREKEEIVATMDCE